MPQINRVRIINFTYNNHLRNIVDETFDFFQGENALLNLKNGGGKSVLVQLLLQPIIPKTRLMGRRMEDFFRGKKTPAYVLVEWKLEERGGYLLTGIAITNRTSQVREQDDSQNSIKYFTFTSHYREANAFDLTNIPLIRQEKEKVLVEDFKQARKLISAKEKDMKFNVQVFSDDEGGEYRRYLETFNLFQDEWKSIILKINESEGGVIEIFEKCKTSQQLMNDWILKSVEKVVNKEDKDKKKLELMLENLVEEMISNEQFIYEKELYESFLKKSDEFLQSLEELVKSLDKERNLEGLIAALYYFLKQEINRMQDEVSLQDEKIHQREQELEKINLEERSKAYYDEQANVEKLVAELDEAEGKLDGIRKEIEINQSEITVQEAAREYSHQKRIREKIAGILEEIERIKSSGDYHEKIRNLEYSLKIAYGKLLEDLRLKANELTEQLAGVEEEVLVCDGKINDLDRENGTLQSKTGALKSGISHFEKNEPNICDELQFYYERNLLGEIEERDFQEFFKKLENHTAKLYEEKTESNERIEVLKSRTREIKEEARELRGRESAHRVEVARKESEIKAYYAEEEALKPVFDRYNLNFKRRFNHQENGLFIKNKIHELEKTQRALDLRATSLNETIESLKRGTLHVSKEFRQWLINHDIEFETGENYLQKQNGKIRDGLIKQNPILPYAFLLYDEDLEKLKTTEIDCLTHEMVPLLSYSNINEAFSIVGNTVAFGDSLQMMCLYDRRMLDRNNLDDYLAELGEKLTDVKEQLSHYREELETARDDLQKLKKFTFDKNYIYELEEQSRGIETEIQEFNAELEGLESEQQKASEEMTRLDRRILEIDGALEDTKMRKQRALVFQEDNEAYLQDRRALQELEDSLERIMKEKDVIFAQKKGLTQQRDTLLEGRTELRGEIQRKEALYQQYETAPEAVLLEEEIGIMEARLQRLKSRMTSNLERLETELNDQQIQLKEKEEALASYQLEEEDYKDVEFDSSKLSSLKRKVRGLDKEKTEIEKTHSDLREKVGKARGKLETAENEVMKLAEEPLKPAMIKLNFSSRRKEERTRIQQARTMIKRLQDDSRKYDRLANKIEEQIEVGKFPVNPNYEVKRGIEEDYAELTIELKGLQKENKQYENNLQNRYRDMKGKYKNRHIENILIGLDPLIEGAQLDKSKYYYLGERLLLSNETLEKLIRACEQRLANLEKNKNDMIQHSYLHAKQVYEEIQKIAENSSIRIEGKNRPVQMLRINMEPISETEEENSTKMQSYIEDCVNIIKRDMEEDKKIEEIRKKISRYMATRELLHVLSDLGKMTISAYKIDINVQNSGYKSWEQVMKENSGGERFVSFFAVLVALMSYTRTSMKYEDDYERNTDTKVLIMDNPFGPISSEHLLRPLFDIAKKYNTQLICLTDLKQNSILNCFNLIYMIKIRQNVFGTNEYIQLEQQIKENAEVEQDGKLEKAIFKAEEIEQISLF